MGHFSPCFGYSLHSESMPIGTFQTVSLGTSVRVGIDLEVLTVKIAVGPRDLDRKTTMGASPRCDKRSRTATRLTLI
jgi:hypothetical protein